jgi:hypothetical protein
MRSASYSMERIAYATWKEENFESMEAQSTSTEKLGHSEKWMKNTEKPDMNGGTNNQESFTLSEAYMGSYGRICIHM